MSNFYFCHLAWCPCALWNLCLFAPASESRGLGTFPQLFAVTCPALLRTLLFQSLPSTSSWCSDIQMSHQMHYFFSLLGWFYMWDSFQMPVLNRLVCLQFPWDIEQNSIRCVYGMIYPQAWSSAQRGEFAPHKLQFLGHPEQSNSFLCIWGIQSKSPLRMGQVGVPKDEQPSFIEQTGGFKPWGLRTFAQNLPRFSLSSFILKFGICIEPTFSKLVVKMLFL